MTTSIQLIRELLLADTSVKTVSGGRIYVGQIPQDATVLCIVLHAVWDEPEYQIGGASPARNSRVRVECIDKMASTTDLLSGAVSDALIDIAHHRVVVDGDKLTDSVTVWRLGTYESDVGEDRQYYRVILEFRLRWLQ